MVSNCYSVLRNGQPNLANIGMEKAAIAAMASASSVNSNPLSTASGAEWGRRRTRWPDPESGRLEKHGPHKSSSTYAGTGFDGIFWAGTGRRAQESAALAASIGQPLHLITRSHSATEP